MTYIDTGTIRAVREEATTTADLLADILYLLRERLPEPEGVKDEPDPSPDDSHTSDGRCKYPKTCKSEGLHGEPVGPGDLRAGDRVAFTWEGTGERIACTLEGHQDGNVLRSGTPDRNDYYPNVTLHGREWCVGISDVRLIERAPREDSDERIRVYVEMVERAEEAERRVDELEPALARSETEHAALRADVEEFQYRHRGYSGAWELMDILDRDTERGAR